MRHVILSELSMILSPGGKHLTELVAGDSVRGYDQQNRRVLLVTLTKVEKLSEQSIVPRAMVTGYRVIPALDKTMALTSCGVRPLTEGQFIGHCNTNPSKLLVRTVDFRAHTSQLYDIIELSWEGADYIWADGLLVGCAYECNS